MPDTVLEDKWKLNIHYIPIVTLKLGTSLNPDYIKEGDVVYFMCSVKANPKTTRLTWYKGTEEIHHNADAGIILSEQTLVLQSVNKSDAGDYSCIAHNSEGSATSNLVSLEISYAPMCEVNETGVYGALEYETIQLQCSVNSSPPPSSFMWIMDSLGEQTQIPSNLFTTSGLSSTLRFTPTSETDFGTVLCIANNSVGTQVIPCRYELVAAGHPMPLQNCTILNHSDIGLHVTCDEGFDGALPQTFYLEVYELPSLIISLSPVLVSILAVVALLCAGICGVITALYRRHTASRLDRPRAAGLYIDHSVDSISKQDHLNTYCGSPSLDYCNRYELKMDGELEEIDPDIIPCNYDKKSISEFNNLPTPGTDIGSSRIFCEQVLSIPTSVSLSSNISVVNRGVCARSSDIAAARHLANLNVRESCI
ncbi:unnamed protein product [Diatraea saccharalis]|uniref:Ig-like domain-containing protein n=1 Tax=Diatraea saccharalis TaxID=40085 RepID=A0A9N9WE09_9NEOP|nr:unnamed protein product [Diatraea saccharalis]